MVPEAGRFTPDLRHVIIDSAVFGEVGAGWQAVTRGNSGQRSGRKKSLLVGPLSRCCCLSGRNGPSKEANEGSSEMSLVECGLV